MCSGHDVLGSFNVCLEISPGATRHIIANMCSEICGVTAEGRGSSFAPYLAESPGVSGVRARGMVRTPADNALSLDSSQPSGKGEETPCLH